MARDITATRFRPGSYTLLRFLSAFPIAFFSGALLTDIAYLRTTNMLWADFSAWLLAVAMFMGGLAAIVGLITLLASRAARAHRPLWPVVLGSAIVLGLGLVNNFVHSRDAWTSVVPLGLILSAATVILTILTLWVSAPHETTRETTLAPVDYLGARS